jgi:hypothetical protein
LKQTAVLVNGSLFTGLPTKSCKLVGSLTEAQQKILEMPENFSETVSSQRRRQEIAQTPYKDL